MFALPWVLLLKIKICEFEKGTEILGEYAPAISVQGWTLKIIVPWNQEILKFLPTSPK